MGLGGDGEDDDNQPRTVGGRGQHTSTSTPANSGYRNFLTATACDHHTLEGCRRWQKLSLLPYGKLGFSVVRLRQPQPEHGPSRFVQPTYTYVADGCTRFQEFHPIRLPNYQKAQSRLARPHKGGKWRSGADICTIWCVSV